MKWLLVSLCFVAVACGIPRDPEGTLERVTGGTMRVGVTAAEPWVVLEGDEAVGGVEVRLIEEFAAEIDAAIEWTAGSEEEILSAIELRELDLAIGGFGSTSPWASKVTFTHPYLTTFATVGVPEADEVAVDITGMEVAVERGTALAGLLKKTDAVAVLVDDITSATGAAAVENWLLDDLGLQATDVRLEETDHVIAVPLGENAWLTSLERFLLARPSAIEELLAEEGRP